MTSGPLHDSYFRDFLITNQNTDGGWGYHPASPSSVEATAWALTALISSRQSPPPADVCARARDWLLRAQRADGSWPAFPGQPQGCWVTSIVARALYLQGGAQKAVERGLHWLLNAWPAEGTLWWRLRQSIISISRSSPGQLAARLELDAGHGQLGRTHRARAPVSALSARAHAFSSGGQAPAIGGAHAL